MINQLSIAVTTTGSAGSATGSGDSEYVVNGKVLAVYLDYHASAPATTDITLKTKGRAGPSYNVLVVGNNATDVLKFPRLQVHDGVDGSAMTYDGTRKVAEPAPVADYLTVDVAGADALTGCVVVYVWYER